MDLYTKIAVLYRTKFAQISLYTSFFFIVQLRYLIPFTICLYNTCLVCKNIRKANQLKKSKFKTDINF